MWRVVNPGVLVQTPCWVPLCCPAFPSSFHYMGSRLTSQQALCVCVCVCVLVFATLRTVAHQTPLSMGFSRPCKLSYLCKFLETRIQFD